MAELAKLIRVKREEVNISYSQVKRWYTTFFNSLADTNKRLIEKGEEFDRNSGSITIFLHGAGYDLWYVQGLNRMSLSLYDVDLDDVSSSAIFKLVKWKDVVRHDVAAQKR